jgi:hypothetical protein
LREVYITQCRINKIKEEAFLGEKLEGPKSELQVIDLGHNLIKRVGDIKIINSNYFKKLVHINLSHNSLTKLDQNSFKALKNLKTINLSHNSITEILPSAFKNLKNVETIDLSHNQINRICKKSLVKLPKLNKIDLSHNCLDKFHSRDLRNVREISLAHNNLTRLQPWCFKGFRKLTLINLSFNQIGIVDLLTFKDLMNLEEIDLSSNRISKIYPRAFVNLPALRIVDLSYNGLARPKELRSMVEEMFELVHDGGDEHGEVRRTGCGCSGKKDMKSDSRYALIQQNDQSKEDSQVQNAVIITKKSLYHSTSCENERASRRYSRGMNDEKTNDAQIVVFKYKQG